MKKYKISGDQQQIPGSSVNSKRSKIRSIVVPIEKLVVYPHNPRKRDFELSSFGQQKEVK